MKRILYASGGFITDDEVAEALMQYASVLAIIESADVVTVPGLDEEGRICEIQLLVGPASQILAMSHEAEHTELRSGRAVADLHERSKQRLPNAIGVADVGTAGPAESDAESTSHE